MVFFMLFVAVYFVGRRGAVISVSHLLVRCRMPALALAIHTVNYRAAESETTKEVAVFQR